MSRRLLFISPIFPAADATGSAKRASIFLDAFASDFEVHLVVIPLAGLPVTDDQWAQLERRCQEIYIVPAEEPDGAHTGQTAVPLVARYTAGSVPDRVRETIESVSPDVVHVFRLYLAPLALVDDRRWTPQLQLDLDDHESRTHAAIARRLEYRGLRAFAHFELTESHSYRQWEDALIPRFDRVFVTSERDRARINGWLAFKGLEVVPNAIAIPEKRSPPRSRSPFTFLFVGTLDYFPNEDGVVWFLEEVLPELRTRATTAFRIRVVGPHPPDIIHAVAAGAPEVEIAGFVPDLAAVYEHAHAVVAPIHAGGGTRIKILEGFAFHRPVVATTAAVDGIDARHEEHLLIADDPKMFASCCLRLMNDASLGHALSERALELARARYDAAKIQWHIRQLTLSGAPT